MSGPRSNASKKKLLRHCLHFVFSAVLLVFLLGAIEVLGSYLLTKQIATPKFFKKEMGHTTRIDGAQGSFEVVPKALDNPKFQKHYTGPDMGDVDLRKAYLPTRFVNGVQVPQADQATSVSARLKSTGEILFENVESTDQFGRRKTPVQATKEPRRFHFLTFGCSYAFGFAVGDKETLSYFIGDQAPQYWPYNLGIAGGFPANALGLITKANYLDDIKEPSGLAVYVMIDDQMRRAVGEQRALTEWVKNRPFAEKDSSGHWTAQQTWAEARPFRVHLADLLYKSSFLKWIGFSWPKIEEQDYSDNAEILAEIKSQYQKKFGSQNRFVVVLYFENGVNSTRLIPYLEKLKVEYLDYSKLRLETLTATDPYVIYHPTAAANEVLARMLVRDLGLN